MTLAHGALTGAPWWFMAIILTMLAFAAVMAINVAYDIIRHYGLGRQRHWGQRQDLDKVDR